MDKDPFAFGSIKTLKASEDIQIVFCPPPVCLTVHLSNHSLTCPDDLGDDVEISLHVFVAQVLQEKEKKMLSSDAALMLSCPVK